MVYIIGDTHFGHTSLVEKGERPFSSIEEHDAYIIKRWNQTVSQNDHVFILGDLVRRNRRSLESYMAELGGHKTFLKGNHDLWLQNMDPETALQHFDGGIHDILTLEVGTLTLTLSHFPLLSWPKARTGNSFNINAHLHALREGLEIDLYKRIPYSLCASIDILAPITDWAPATFHQLTLANKLFYGTEKYLPGSIEKLNTLNVRKLEDLLC